MTHKLIHTPDYLLVVDDSGTRIAHLPLNDSPILEGVALLPPFSRHQEDGIEEYSKECNQLYKDWLVTGYKAGYNKAKEKYRFTEEDMRKAIGETRKGMLYNKQYEDEYIQSLSQPKMPVGFECDVKSFEQEYRIPIREVRITTPEGHTQWVGKYIY